MRFEYFNESKVFFTGTDLFLYGWRQQFKISYNVVIIMSLFSSFLFWIYVWVSIVKIYFNNRTEWWFVDFILSLFLFLKKELFIYYPF